MGIEDITIEKMAKFIHSCMSLDEEQVVKKAFKKLDRKISGFLSLKSKNKEGIYNLLIKSGLVEDKKQAEEITEYFLTTKTYIGRYYIPGGCFGNSDEGDLLFNLKKVVDKKGNSRYASDIESASDMYQKPAFSTPFKKAS